MTTWEETPTTYMLAPVKGSNLPPFRYVTCNSFWESGEVPGFGSAWFALLRNNEKTHMRFVVVEGVEPLLCGCSVEETILGIFGECHWALRIMFLSRIAVEVCGAPDLLRVAIW